MKKYKKGTPMLNHSVGDKISENTHIRSAEQMYKRLCDVKTGFVDFIPQDLSMASNCLELYYKEFIIVNHIPASERLLKEAHNLYGLAKKIEENGITLCDGGKKKKEWFYDILNDLQDCYISTKYYGHEPDAGDLREAMKLIKKQREVIMTYLDPSKSWKVEQNTVAKVMGNHTFKENGEEESYKAEESREL